MFLQIAAHCNREQLGALIGTGYDGIVISDRWNGFSHLDPTRRQVCWSHIQRDFRRHADGLAEQKTFGEKGVPLVARLFAAWRASAFTRSASSTSPTAAWQSIAPGSRNGSPARSARFFPI